MTKHIAIIQGQPDPQGKHFGNALADAYMRGAKSAGHQVELISVAILEFPLLRSKDEYENQSPPGAIVEAQKIISRADHIVIIYPLWTGTMPALLKGFFEQLLRPGFAISKETDKLPEKLLKGKSARIVVTMGMPALAYRWYFRAHSLKNLKRNMLSFCGIGPIRESLFGLVETVSQARREKWLNKMYKLGVKSK